MKAYFVACVNEKAVCSIAIYYLTKEEFNAKVAIAIAKVKKKPNDNVTIWPTECYLPLIEL